MNECDHQPFLFIDQEAPRAMIADDQAFGRATVGQHFRCFAVLSGQGKQAAGGGVRAVLPTVAGGGKWRVDARLRREHIEIVIGRGDHSQARAALFGRKNAIPILILCGQNPHRR